MEKKWVVAGLLSIFFLLAVFSMRINSATSDEVTHIPSGYSYWKYFDYTLNPEHPPLVKLWATIPLLFINPTLPVDSYFEQGDQWVFGKQFLYESGNDADQIYFWSRMMMVLLALLLGYYIYRWASELYGWKAGLLGLLLYVFDPNILANATLVHTDLPIAAGIFILVYYFWKFTKQETLSFKHLLILGILTGICFAVKYTGIFVIGFLILLYIIHLYFDRFQKQHTEKEHVLNITTRIQGFFQYLFGDNELKELTKGAKVLGIIFALGFVFLIATYGFVHFSSYFTGFADVTKHSADGHPAYLFGMTSNSGWWYYFIVAFFVKTPIPTILFALCSFILLFKRKELWNKDTAFLLVPAALYFIAFMLNNINIGVRHILPVYPFLFVFIGSLVVVDWKIIYEKAEQYKKALYAVGIILLGWLVVGTLLAYPYFIPYFNEFAGGAENGHKYLLDSNLDWGQGLKETAEWLEEHGYKDHTLRMSYFGNEDPAYRGIVYEKILCSATPGLHVISANKLYDFQGNQHGCTNWLLQYEPVAIIGYSMYIYDITDSVVVENYNACKLACTKACAESGLMYKDSIYTDKCICLSCQEASNEELGIV